MNNSPQTIFKDISQTNSEPTQNDTSSQSQGTHQYPEAGYSTGRWTQQENEQFINALRVYGKEWKKVQEFIPTRSSTQIRSHAQKFFLKNVEATAVIPMDTEGEKELQIKTEEYLGRAFEDLHVITQICDKLDSDKYKDMLTNYIFEISNFYLSLPSIIKAKYHQSFDMLMGHSKLLKEFYINTASRQKQDAPYSGWYIHYLLIKSGQKKLSEVDFFRVFKPPMDSCKRTGKGKPNSAFQIY